MYIFIRYSVPLTKEQNTLVISFKCNKGEKWINFIKPCNEFLTGLTNPCRHFFKLSYILSANTSPVFRS